MVEYCKTMFITIFRNVMTWFDQIMIDNGWIVWLGTVFLMITGYRFIIRPLFGVFSLGDITVGKSDSNSTFSKKQGQLYSYRLDKDGNTYKHYW